MRVHTKNVLIAHCEHCEQVPKKSSAYTIPKAPRAITRKTPQAYSIGPGEYCTIATVPEGPAFTIPASGAHKPPTQDEDTPAPGATFPHFSETGPG